LSNIVKNRKVALITGASSGIGRDFARELCKMGYNLVLVARDKEKLENLQIELSKNTNCDIKIISMDLANSKNCKDLYDLVGSVDILINNAGFGAFGNFAETDLEKEIDMINTNITAVHILTKLFLKDMKEKKSGYILNVSSIASFMPGPLMAGYYASKAYVTRLSEAIREELRKEKSNVRISILCPGPVNTNFNDVANVKFNLQSLTSEYVAKYAIKKMFNNKFLIVPGIKIKILKFITKISPNNLTVKFVYKMQKRKQG